jgi:predicted dithiol-disulfide oxidoreductase (DUF899 family)
MRADDGASDVRRVPKLARTIVYPPPRKELLVKEKVFAWHRNRVHADWRLLPMTRIEEPDTFEGRDGPVGLAELFGSRSPADVPAG